jgi:hypothetical protein
MTFCLNLIRKLLLIKRLNNKGIKSENYKNKKKALDNYGFLIIIKKKGGKDALF